MTTNDEEVNPKAWRQFYEAAVLEPDPTKRQERIAEAERAIAKRALVVMREGGDPDEREALANAMQVLEALKKRSSESRNRGAEPEKENNIGDPNV